MNEQIDVERIKKMNALAFEFRKHNIAVTSQDAAEQAQEVFRGTKESVGIESTSPQTLKEPLQIEKESESESNGSYLLEKKFDYLLQTLNSKTEQKLKSLSDNVDALRAELEAVKSELKRFPDEFQRKKLREKEAEAQKVLKTEPKEEHPRQGKFNSEDVRIDKFFYYGSK